MKENRPSSWLLDPETIKALALFEANLREGCNREMARDILSRLKEGDPLKDVLLKEVLSVGKNQKK